MPGCTNTKTNKEAAKKKGKTKCDDTTKACPPKPAPVSVDITLSAAVACPCHPFSITATGSPGGGTYSWTVSGGAELVDGAGNATNIGPAVNLRSFQPDHVNGNIPEQTATVRVTYTHANGTATDSEAITIHKIDFAVTNPAITPGVTQANETHASPNLGHAPGAGTMSTNPSVEIKLDATCPRKAACAQNHQVGWLQTEVRNERLILYPHTRVQIKNDFLPMRDQIGGPSPFYQGVKPFTGDRDKQAVRHSDSPGQNALWTDPRAAAPGPPPATNKQLRQLSFSSAFHAWLVVQNIEWSAHDRDNSFVFVRNFAWAMELNVTVDTTQAVGSRCTPSSNPPTIGALEKGRGPVMPVLTAPYPNVNNTVTITAIPP